MRPSCHLHIPGGNTYSLSMVHIQALQSIATDLEAVAYPLLLRLGSKRESILQPITAKALLDEVVRLKPGLHGIQRPGLLFRDTQGTHLGSIYASSEADETGLTATAEGIRLVVSSFPPPAGFRSRRGLKAGLYECFFRQITIGPKGIFGFRTAAMGGSGAPIMLAELPLPPVTRWDFSHVAGRPEVATIDWVEVPAAEAYRDAVHALEAACTDSLRMMKPLHIRFS